jgi:hypothetical protein
MAMRDLPCSTDCSVYTFVEDQSSCSKALDRVGMEYVKCKNQSVMSRHSKNIQPSQADWQSEKFWQHVIGGGTG